MAEILAYGGSWKNNFLKHIYTIYYIYEEELCTNNRGRKNVSMMSKSTVFVVF